MLHKNQAKLNNLPYMQILRKLLKTLFKVVALIAKSYVKQHSLSIQSTALSNTFLKEEHLLVLFWDVFPDK